MNNHSETPQTEPTTHTPNYTNSTDWKFEEDSDGIVWLHLDKQDSTTNVLSRALLEQLNECLDQIEEKLPRGLVFLSDKKSGFLAGADIQEFTKIELAAEAQTLIRRGQNTFARIAALPIPTVAMIHGYCLGGGFELVAACRYRIADQDPSTRIGLPEVFLGIHPGFGGCVRMAHLTDAITGMDLILSGRTIAADKAQKAGLVDCIVPRRHLRTAAKNWVLNPPPKHELSWWKRLTHHALARPVIAHVLRRKLAQRVRPQHYPAPFAAIRLWEKYASDPQQMMIKEAESVAKLISGETAKNLIRLFFLQEQLKSVGKKSDITPTSVHIIGAGVMGGDIAAWCALKGFHVTLQDREPQHLSPALARAHKLFKRRLKKPRLIRSAMDRLIPDVEGYGLTRADVIIEAIYENVEAKQKLFKEIEQRAKPDALLASNTSSIPLDNISDALHDSSRLVGLHFFNPVAKMQLVEIVCSPRTDANVVRNAAAFARHLDRLPIPVQASPGFLVNRVLVPYLMEAVYLASEGIPVSGIDKAAKDFGMPMGPIELSDTVGLDVCLSVAQILAKTMPLEIPDQLHTMVNNGQIGKKSGRGFYRYKNGKPIIESAERHFEATADITDRLIFAMLNEAVACLHEQVVDSADRIDAGLVFGAGFAPFRGGPLHYIQQQDPSSTLQRLEKLEHQYGARFHPHEGWQTLVKNFSDPA